MLIPVLPLPDTPATKPRSLTDMVLMPLLLGSAAAGVGLAVTGGITGTFWALWGGAAVWVLAGLAWERSTGRFR